MQLIQLLVIETICERRSRCKAVVWSKWWPLQIALFSRWSEDIIIGVIYGYGGGLSYVFLNISR